jgi:hypothetical protein
MIDCSGDDAYVRRGRRGEPPVCEPTAQRRAPTQPPRPRIPFLLPASVKRGHAVRATRGCGPHPTPASATIYPNDALRVTRCPETAIGVETAGHRS